MIPLCAGCKERQLNPDQSSLKGWEGKKGEEGKGCKHLWCNLTKGYLWFKSICVGTGRQYVVIEASPKQITCQVKTIK